ncbi:melanoma-associated antigen G1-like [Fopius arisanus]|uniref:Melanoma-associated antigen G1-like n=1 Tax=Fopius arisanus TaxID=64838 RepID=A0A9R1TH61_9HYME|nr:PREDICTED: melanoma-associated antigen G1-like [Fopius arisanus]XP_011309340.1 PREDICTED: melanoma-associated antigen G1-like [Fopius arisanus]
MPRRSQRLRSSSFVVLDSDEEAGPSNAPRRSPIASQRSQRHNDDDTDEEPATQSQRRGAELPEDEENHELGTLLKFLLSAASSKNVIKQADIKTYGMSCQAKYYQSLMAKAKVVLHEIFGYNLINIGGQKWIIVNALPHNNIRVEVEDVPAQTLLFLVLSHVFLSGEPCAEDNLIQFLKGLNIWREHGGHHPYFGNVEEMVQKTFVQQIYLVRSKESKGDNEMYVYTWGRRATEEFDPRYVLEFISKVYKDRPASSWNLQYRKAQGIKKS